MIKVSGLAQANQLLFLLTFLSLCLSLQQALMGWVWVLLACSFCIAGYKILTYASPITSMTLNLLSVFCLAILIAFAPEMGVMHSMINLMVVACCLKIINLHHKRDYQIVVMTSLFLIACGFMFHQGMGMAIFYALLVAQLLFTVYALQTPRAALTKQLKGSSAMLIQALPIALILFVVMPKLPPLWQVPAEQNTKTGLSDTLTPGDIANLAKSDDLVFRAEFKGPLPSAEQRYWRSIVLDEFDGKTWRLSQQQLVQQAPLLASDIATLLGEHTNDSPENNTADFYDYTVLTQANDQDWLYALDLAQLMPLGDNLARNISSFYVNQAYQVQVRSPEYGQQQYRVKSFPQARLNTLPQQASLTHFLQVPSTGNPETADFIKQTITSTMQPAQIITRINEVFSQQNFAYTLRPPLMQTSPIDAFLFEHQQGFCSHYASAMAYMLRLAGVPSRIVLGYQGGEEQINQVLSIYQYDAHAWVEAWLPNKGWQRLDPTALVAPSRVMAGLQQALQNTDEFLFDSPFSVAHFTQYNIINNLRSLLANIDYAWSQHVIGFDTDTQAKWLKTLFGSDKAKSLTYAMLISFSGIAVFIVAIFCFKDIETLTPQQKAYRKLLKKLAKQGHHKTQQETLANFAKRINPALNEAERAQLHAFVITYYEEAYSSHRLF